MLLLFPFKKNSEYFFKKMRNLPEVWDVRLSGEIDVIYVEACNGNFFISKYLLKQKLTTVAGTAVVAWTNVLRKADNFPQPDICILCGKTRTTAQCEASSVHVAFFCYEWNK